MNRLCHACEAVRFPSPAISPIARHSEGFAGGRRAKSGFAPLLLNRTAEPPPIPRTRYQIDAKREADRHRELLLSVLSSQPTSRDAKAFIKNFGGVEGAPRLREAEKRQANLATLGSRRHENLALVYLQAGLADNDLEHFASSLVHLQMLGLMPVVMLRDGEVRPGQALRSGNGAAQRMFEEVVRVAGFVDASDGRAVPLYDSIFALDGPGSWGVLGEQDEGYLEETGVSVDSKPILHALRYGQIPIITPLAYSDTHYVPVSTTAAMVQLSRTLQKEASTGTMSPLKVVLINDRGGISTSHGPLSMVNLLEDYQDLVATLGPLAEAGDVKARGALNDLWTVKQTLENLPPSASAILASASVSAAAISNLITDKPTFSSSLDAPPDTFLVGGAEMDSANTPTVVRNGLHVAAHKTLDTLDLPRLKDLLEASFGRTLEDEPFWARMRDVLDMVIVAGDYDGASIMTREPWPGTEGLIYLDKFAASPRSQGTGVADILWRRMAKEYDLWFWRSRTVNPVNKWYFERADGTVRLAPDGYWTVFWHGARTPPALIRAYCETGAKIPASFKPVPKK